MAATLATFDTVETADCVEACPVPGFESSLVVATYQLHKAVVDSSSSSAGAASDQPQTGDRRSGTLQHFRVGCDAADIDNADVTVSKTQDMATSSGIFDIKWSTKALNGKAVLGAATAGGTLELYELAQESGDQQVLRHTGISSEANADSMCLSLDWSNRVHTTPHPSISAWIVAFNCHDPNVLFSGADDAVLKGWDLRQRNDAGAFSPIFKNARQHSMGVCSIQFHPHDDRLVAVGSYDEQIGVWDHRNMTRPLATYAAGGGVWRLKWHPAPNRKLLLTACMHNGFHVLALEPDKAKLREVAGYNRHESLAYGVDWWQHPASLQAAAPVVGSASFYDHAFHLWRQTLA
ncbi:hypothetical protein BBJ28_00019078 [Nothophytophthora sp. Chile5]|nr:hypothetical protein BBJ28_00019078 [Nothophytophthora sp. Chile5]